MVHDSTFYKNIYLYSELLYTQIWQIKLISITTFLGAYRSSNLQENRYRVIFAYRVVELYDWQDKISVDVEMSLNVMRRDATKKSVCILEIIKQSWTRDFFDVN